MSKEKKQNLTNDADSPKVKDPETPIKQPDATDSATPTPEPQVHQPKIEETLPSDLDQNASINTDFIDRTNKKFDRIDEKMDILSEGLKDQLSHHKSIDHNVTNLQNTITTLGKNVENVVKAIPMYFPAGIKSDPYPADALLNEGDQSKKDRSRYIDEEYEEIKKKLCEDLKSGKICEEECTEITSFSLKFCDPPIVSVSDSSNLSDMLAIAEVTACNKKVTDPDVFKKLSEQITFRITVCGQVELATDDHQYSVDFIKLIEFPILERYRLLQDANVNQNGKFLVKLNSTLLQTFKHIERIKIIPVLSKMSNGIEKFTYLDPIEVLMTQDSGGGSIRAIPSGNYRIANFSENGSTKVQLQRTNVDDTVHNTKSLWDAIRVRIPDFALYDRLMDAILGNAIGNGASKSSNNPSTALRNSSAVQIQVRLFQNQEKLHPLPFTNIQAYRLLKSATQAFLWAANNTFNSNDAISLDKLKSYITSYPSVAGDENLTPYIQNILSRLDEWREELLERKPELLDPLHNHFGIDHLPGIELIWSYWTEQSLMVQTINAVSLRFQNLSLNSVVDPLAQIDIDPLRPLANLFWGYIQDEQHTLSIKRRAYEYDHTYGLTLEGRAVPTFRSVDSRSKFLEAFHNLLHSTSIFYKESDDTTRIADAFSILNNLREVHLLLAEGNHNAYGNLTWTARQEMMIQQYLLARPEMREFLGGRIMVPYKEPWMDRVDRMRQIQNWGSTSVTHYYDLAQYGEVLLLTIRAHDWSNEEDSNVAGSWATSFRNEAQRYIHSYRTVTGVDLSADAQLSEASFMQPSTLIQRRLQGETRSPLRNGRIVGNGQPS
jgi:hypothetical protein